MPEFDNLDYVDFSYRGFQYNYLDSQKYPFVIEQEEAIKNVIKMWLASKKGDYGRQLNLGGDFDYIIGRQMVDSLKTQIITDIKTKISESFEGFQVSNITVDFNFEQHKVIVNLYIIDTKNKMIFPLGFSVTP